jgi:hypothetical protein
MENPKHPKAIFAECDSIRRLKYGNTKSYLPGRAVKLFQALGICNPEISLFVFAARSNIVAAEA